jgi:1-aminocyclopropane-1-carboxylate deaminase/D-cysteine desulfhydrase-like pyridoxal-dependent ACC family enzyme
MDLATLHARLEAQPRADLCVLPTPLRCLDRLRAALGPETPELRVKLDEMTGFGLGGNKVRKLDRLLAPEQLEGITHLVTTGGPQSNHCRVTAAAAAHLGLGCVLVINGEAGEPPRGNAMLHRRFGAHIHTVADRSEREAALSRVADEIAEAGGQALVLPLGASTGRGALGYVDGLLEFHEQLAPAPDRAVHLFVSSSSGGTLGGLWAALGLLERTDLTITAISADTPAADLRRRAHTLAREALTLLETDPSVVDEVADRVNVRDDEVGEGYGVPTAGSKEAEELFARSEALLVDPWYTAKAAAGMIAAVRRGELPAGDRVVFWHTGGHPALFSV